MPGECMRVGLTGPFEIAPLLPHLDAAELANRPVPHGLGGTPLVNLTLELLRRGLYVSVFTLDPSVDREVILQGPRLRICVGPYRHERRGRDFFKVERDYLLQAIKRERPDLIHAHWTYEFALAAIESGLPHLITAHDAPFQILRYDFTPYRFIRTLMAISVLHRAQALTAVSPHVAEHLGRFFRYRRRISVVPNGLWQDLFERHAERPRLAVTGQVTFATVLNGWGHLKNAETAIRAFAIVRAQMPSARMLMFGKGYGVGEVAQMWARQKGLDASIEFRGAQPYESMLEQLATEVDVLVHPSREESFCMVIAEAMALRVPVVAGSRSGAVPWILDQGTAGLLVDVRSQAQVAREMVALGRDPEYRRRVATVGWELASQRYTMGLVADQYVRCYQEILQTHAHGESVG